MYAPHVCWCKTSAATGGSCRWTTKVARAGDCSTRGLSARTTTRGRVAAESTSSPPVAAVDCAAEIGATDSATKVVARAKRDGINDNGGDAALAVAETLLKTAVRRANLKADMEFEGRDAPATAKLLACAQATMELARVQGERRHGKPQGSAQASNHPRDAESDTRATWNTTQNEVFLRANRPYWHPLLLLEGIGFPCASH